MFLTYCFWKKCKEMFLHEKYLLKVQPRYQILIGRTWKMYIAISDFWKLLLNSFHCYTSCGRFNINRGNGFYKSEQPFLLVIGADLLQIDAIITNRCTRTTRVLLKILQISQEKTCAGISFVTKVIEKETSEQALFLRIL